jgi:hypothetical protein
LKILKPKHKTQGQTLKKTFQAPNNKNDRDKKITFVTKLCQFVEQAIAF